MRRWFSCRRTARISAGDFAQLTILLFLEDGLTIRPKATRMSRIPLYKRAQGGESDKHD